MDGSGSSVVISSGYAYRTYDLVFTLDRSQQALYWINATRYNHCYLQRSNTGGSNQSIVYNATRYTGGCSNYYYYYYTTQLDIDFFGGAVYTYSPYYRYIQSTNTEGRPYIRTINNYRSYICSQNSFHGIKVISRQRQLQSNTHNDNYSDNISQNMLLYSYSMQVSIHVPTTMVDVLIFACSVLPTLMATLVPVTVGHSYNQIREIVLPVHNNRKTSKVIKKHM